MKATRRTIVYVGFLDDRPHMQTVDGAQILVTYVSRAAARRAYHDVRKASLKTFPIYSNADPSK